MTRLPCDPQVRIVARRPRHGYWRTESSRSDLAGMANYMGGMRVLRSVKSIPFTLAKEQRAFRVGLWQTVSRCLL